MDNGMWNGTGVCECGIGIINILKWEWGMYNGN